MQVNIVEPDDADFEALVLQESFRRPVLVDFWAPWCGPCRVLGPALEKAAADLAGRVLLAKVNVDESPGTAERYRISSIPDVRLFKDGEAVDGFVGALPPAAIRQFLEKHLPSPAQAHLDQAEKDLAQGLVEEARRMLEKARQVDPEAEMLAVLEAGILLQEGRTDEAEAAIRRIDAFGPRKGERAALEARLAFERECRAGAGEAAGPLDEAYREGNCLAARGEYRASLEKLLGVLERDRNFRDGEARKAMLRIFDVVGPREALSNEFRDRMARLLY